MENPSILRDHENKSDFPSLTLFFFETVENTFGLLSRVGTVLGARLFCIHVKNKSLAFTLRALSISIPILIQVISIVISLSALVPTPEEDSSRLEFDFGTVFQMTICAWFVDSLVCFSISNYANYILTKRCFFDQCSRLGMIRPKSVEGTVRACSRRTKFDMVIAVILTFVFLFSSIILNLTGWWMTEDEAKMYRARWWLSIGDNTATGLGALSHLLATLMAFYNSILYISLCASVRIHFKICCDGMRAETGTTFTKRVIDRYHREYSRAVDMTKLLDKAFRFSCLSQLCIVIISSCLSLYLLTKGSASVRQIVDLVQVLSYMVGIFASTLVPAIRLKEQAEKVSKWLHRWHMKYYDTCEVTGTNVNEGHRNAYISFMQYLISADVGISIGSLAKLEFPLLLSIVSVIITYFLVILQLNTPVNCACNFNSTTT